MEHQLGLSAYHDFEIHLKQITSSETEADTIRSILLSDNNELKDLMATGKLSPDRLGILVNDKPQQRIYMWIIKLGEKKNANPNKIALKEGLSGELYAGFLIFKRMYYEREFRVRLVSVEED